MNTTHNPVVTTADAMVLPWEHREDYHALIHELTETHKPQGATERFLVEELAALMWRKRRLHLAEAASFRNGLNHVTTRTSEAVAKAALVLHVEQVSDAKDAVKEAFVQTDEEATQALAEMQHVEKKVRKALRLLRDGKPNAYERGLQSLPLETRQWWKEELLEFEEEEWSGETREDDDEDGDGVQTILEELAAFLELRVLPWVQQRMTDLTYRDEIRMQAIGEALTVHRLRALAQYEAHLTTQFRQTLAMLIELQARRT
jgi:hypothetical protein